MFCPLHKVSWKKIDAVSKRKPCTVFRNGGNLFQTISTQPVSFWKKRKGYYMKNGYISHSRKHKWRSGNRFKKCSHLRLTKKEVKAKDCLNADSEPFKLLQNIAADENALKDLK